VCECTCAKGGGKGCGQRKLENKTKVEKQLICRHFLHTTLFAFPFTFSRLSSPQSANSPPATFVAKETKFSPRTQKLLSKDRNLSVAELQTQKAFTNRYESMLQSKFQNVYYLNRNLNFDNAIVDWEFQLLIKQSLSKVVLVVCLPLDLGCLGLISRWLLVSTFRNSCKTNFINRN